MQAPLVVFDTETTGPHSPPHLLEIGAIRVEGGEIVAHFASLVRPEAPIDPVAQSLHGIDLEMVRDAPGAGAALRAFFEFAGDALLAAHDAARDAYVLAFECRRHGIEASTSPVVDTLALAKRWLPESPDHRLETLVGFLDLEGDEMHRALPDAVFCWKVLEACLGRMEPSSPRGLAELVSSSKRIVTIAAAGPAAPRIPQRLRPLESAARDGARVVLHYAEDGEVPVPLPVYPRILYRSAERGYLEGECANSGSLKTYRLDRIRRVTPE